jgi:putative tricarboxylic transport membrane protein
VRTVDRAVGAAIALLAVAVFWSARSFPNVPGQKLGAATLPMIVAVGLFVCGLLLVLRGARTAPPAREAGEAGGGGERIAPALGILASIAVYLAASEGVGYLLVAPVSLLIALRALQVRWRPALIWAIVATLAAHVAFYKLLKVPLPWGIVPVFY